EAADAPVLPQRGKPIPAPGQDLVRVGLVADVPDNLVPRGVENLVEGQGELDHPETRPQMPADAGDYLDDVFPDFPGQLLELLEVQGFDVGWRIDSGKKGLLGDCRLLLRSLLAATTSNQVHPSCKGIFHSTLPPCKSREKMAFTIVGTPGAVKANAHRMHANISSISGCRASMIPLRDENPSRSIPWVTMLLIGTNVAVSLYEFTLPPRALEIFVLRFGAIPAAVSSGHPVLRDQSPFPYLTLLTSMFLHGGILHLLGNMLYLWIFGDNVEDRMGPVRFMLFYLICGILAATIQIVARPDSSAPLVGASGAIAGVLGAYALLFPAARIQTLVFLFFFVRLVELPALFVLGVWFVMQLLS